MIQPKEVASYLTELGPYFAVACEAQVIDLSRRTHYGPWVKLRVPETGILEGFEPGQRYQLLMVKLGDDDMPASNEHKPYKLSQLAGAFCVDPEFRHWIKRVYGDDIQDKEAAAIWVRQACGVESRSMLDTNEAAAEIWRDIMRDFDAHKRAANG